LDTKESRKESHVCCRVGDNTAKFKQESKLSLVKGNELGISRGITAALTASQKKLAVASGFATNCQFSRNSSSAKLD